MLIFIAEKVDKLIKKYYRIVKKFFARKETVITEENYYFSYNTNNINITNNYFPEIPDQVLDNQEQEKEKSIQLKNPKIKRVDEKETRQIVKQYSFESADKINNINLKKIIRLILGIAVLLIIFLVFKANSSIGGYIPFFWPIVLSIGLIILLFSLFNKRRNFSQYFKKVENTKNPDQKSGDKKSVKTKIRWYNDWWWNNFFRFVGIAILILATLFVASVVRGFRWEWKGAPNMAREMLRPTPVNLNPKSILYENRGNVLRADIPYTWDRKCETFYNFIPTEEGVRTKMSMTLDRDPSYFWVGYIEKRNGHFIFTTITGRDPMLEGNYTVIFDKDIEIFLESIKRR